MSKAAACIAILLALDYEEEKEIVKIKPPGQLWTRAPIHRPHALFGPYTCRSAPWAVGRQVYRSSAWLPGSLLIVTSFALYRFVVLVPSSVLQRAQGREHKPSHPNNQHRYSPLEKKYILIHTREIPAKDN
ncbi:hypothetical protein E2C01_049506 [Portunus trituberculatus]|uniref:Uncharacterized protein n=1 Tax=Portunus trituberculatus TaxID=210409 RepID=A0A5B7GDX0_PORTR|nr:hypothetical protein [Portunus trituberculatus]